VVSVASTNLTDILAPGITLTITERSGEAEVQGEILAHYGSYLIIKTEKVIETPEGKSIQVNVPLPDGCLSFASYVCFRVNEKSQLCIHLPSQVEKRERRKYLRLPIELEVSYKVEDTAIPSKTINISAGGVYFFTPSRVEVGQEVEMSISLPGETLDLKAKVIRTMQNAATVEFCDDHIKIDKLAGFLYQGGLIKQA